MISSIMEVDMLKIVLEVKEAACKNSHSCSLLMSAIQRKKGAIAKTLTTASKKK